MFHERLWRLLEQMAEPEDKPAAVQGFIRGGAEDLSAADGPRESTASECLGVAVRLPEAPEDLSVEAPPTMRLRYGSY